MARRIAQASYRFFITRPGNVKIGTIGQNHWNDDVIPFFPQERYNTIEVMMMPNSDLKLLGEKVRTERKLAGLTQEQLAERCHVSTKHIANIEKGSMNPSYEILLAIARVLPVSLDALITPGMGKTEIELKEFNRIYLSCPEAVRETLMDSTRTLAKHLTEFYSKIENP